MLALNERPFFEVDDPDGGLDLASTGDMGDSSGNTDDGDGDGGE